MDKTNKIDTEDLLKRLEKGVDIWNLSDFHSDLKHAYTYAITLHDMSDEKFIKFIEQGSDFDLGFKYLNDRVYDKFDDEVFINMAHSELVKYIKWQFYSKIKKLQTAGYRLGDIVRDGTYSCVKNWCITLDILDDDDKLVQQEEASFDDLVKEIELFIKQCQKETERYEKYESLVCDLRDMMEDNDLETDNVDNMNTTALNVIDQLEKQLAEIKKVVKEHLDDKMRI